MVDGHGRFGVRLEVSAGKVSLSFSDRFHCQAGDVGNIDADGFGTDVANIMENGSSPMFMVDDATTAEMLSARKGDASLVLSACHDGSKGRPCGKCKECARAREEFFVGGMLNEMDLPECDLSNRIRNAVASTIGCVNISTTWKESLSRSEAEEVLDELNNKKEND